VADFHRASRASDSGIIFNNKCVLKLYFAEHIDSTDRQGGVRVADCATGSADLELDKHLRGEILES
jgi:hypothetical protein